MKEEWKWAPGYEGVYKVSSNGRVKSFHKNGEKLLAPNTINGGYQQYRLFLSNKTVDILAHRLVLLCFVGECPEGHEADHINRDRADNRLCNLRWITINENRMRKRHPKTIKGRPCASKYRGVTRQTRECKNQWLARVTISGERINIGVFETEEQAHQACEKARREHGSIVF